MPAPDAPAPRTEEEALAAGYKRAFVADEPRLSEALETYQELGFEVVTVPVAPGSADCTECMRQAPHRFQVIYTRKADRSDAADGRR